tara:strand:- start:299 stop:694 length:396 start_codon:yes stop_codon:yes gene_type:complete
MKKLMVIQEHDAVKAGLHWDLRFEKTHTDKNSPLYGEKVLRSFAIPKHKLPEGKERILAVQVGDHAWSYRNFEGNLGPGYGRGSVKMVFNGKVEVEHFDDKKIIFEYEGNKYQIYKCDWLTEHSFMIRRKK